MNPHVPSIRYSMAGRPVIPPKPLRPQEDPFRDRGPGPFVSMLIAFVMYPIFAWGLPCIPIVLFDPHMQSALPLLFIALSHALWWYLFAWRLCLKRAGRYFGQHGKVEMDEYLAYERSLGIPPRTLTFEDLPAMLKFQRDKRQAQRQQARWQRIYGGQIIDSTATPVKPHVKYDWDTGTFLPGDVRYLEEHNGQQ